MNIDLIKSECISWIQDYFNRNGEPDTKVIIGISGGKDSSTVAALCVEALGADRVVGVLMPDDLQYDIGVARALCMALGIKSMEVNIRPILTNLYYEIATSDHEFVANSITKMNTPPRIRMTILYAIANTLNGRVANTSNLSEKFLGYCSKWGDNIGDFSPLGGLTCSEVIELGRSLKLSDEFILKIPEDGLSGKTDEDNFGFSYAEVDNLIRDVHHLDTPHLLEIMQMHNRGKHKLVSIPTYYPEIFTYTY